MPPSPTVTAIITATDTTTPAIRAFLDTVTVTVAPGRRLTLTMKWSDPSGVEHGSGRVLLEGEAVTVPAAMARTLVAEGVVEAID